MHRQVDNVHPLGSRGLEIRRYPRWVVCIYRFSVGTPLRKPDTAPPFISMAG